jgi:hypothetical protein
MEKGLNRQGVIHLWDKIKAKFVAKETGKGLSTNDYTTAEKDKLANLSNYTHPTHNAKSSGLYKITVDAQGHVSNATAVIKTDITNLGIPAQDTTYENATTSLDGLMSKADKLKLDGIVEGAEPNVITQVTQTTADPYMQQFTLNTNETFQVATLNPNNRIDGYKLEVATQDKQGAMSQADKIKLDGFTSASNYALKSDVVGVYKYKGSVPNDSYLPVDGNNQGDVYNIVSASTYGGAGMNVVWTGTSWDALGEAFIVEPIDTNYIDTICVV